MVTDKRMYIVFLKKIYGYARNWENKHTIRNAALGNNTKL